LNVPHNKTVKLTGLSWIENETFDLLARKSLVSNILCTDHNSALSDFDNEAGKFFRCIKDFDGDFNNPNPKKEKLILNGQFIEKWMLKIVCGLIAAKQILLNGDRVNPSMKDIYIDVLFNNATWPDQWGLYFKMPDNNQLHKYDCVSIMPRTANNEVKAAEFLINNFKFNLVLGKPGGDWGIHRINKILLTKDNITKTIEFDWGDRRFNNWVEFKRAGTTKEPPQDWEDWMKK
jgi:hypothetical protein